MLKIPAHKWLGRLQTIDLAQPWHKWFARHLHTSHIADTFTQVATKTSAHRWLSTQLQTQTRNLHSSDLSYTFIYMTQQTHSQKWIDRHLQTNDIHLHTSDLADTCDAQRYRANNCCIMLWSTGVYLYNCVSSDMKTFDRLDCTAS